MGRNKKLKDQRRDDRQTQQARSRFRRHRTKLLIAIGAFAVAAAVVIPAVAPDNATQSINPSKTQEVPMGTQHVTMQTDRGTVQLDLYPDKAPKTVAQITTLIKQGFYNGLTFHRVCPSDSDPSCAGPEFGIVQGGDPTGTGGGNSELPNIPFEPNDLTHERGAIAMARSQSKDSANCQFYIAKNPLTQLDGSYVVFGKVVGGMEVVDQLKKGDKMTTVTLAQ